ncbi:MAG: methionyl-tRNA formyltransferase [Spirochaetaceae bacterium]|nr:MAG: methionyl-tRNA formyltransferase [Spirochaetaceae bacterium]
MRILFAGTPDMAIPSLEALSAQFSVVGVLTAPDAPVGRKRTLTPSPVAARAGELGLPLLRPQRLDAVCREEVAALSPELLVCVAYGKIFGPRFLALFPKGGINLHPSLLPRHRGPSPIPAAILAGDRETGITVQRLAEQMDAGDVLVQERFPLTGQETTGELTERVSVDGAELLVSAIRRIAEGREQAVPQDHDAATYCGLITSADGWIDWSLDAGAINRAVRAYSPWPSAHTLLHDVRLSIHECEPVPAESAPSSAAEPGSVVSVDKKIGILVQTGSGLLSIRRLQLQSRNPLDWNSFANGHRDLVGTVLGGRTTA